MIAFDIAILAQIVKVQCFYRGPVWSEKVGCWTSSMSGWLLDLLTEQKKTAIWRSIGWEMHLWNDKSNQPNHRKPLFGHLLKTLPKAHWTHGSKGPKVTKVTAFKSYRRSQESLARVGNDRTWVRQSDMEQENARWDLELAFGRAEMIRFVSITQCHKSECDKWWCQWRKCLNWYVIFCLQNFSLPVPSRPGSWTFFQVPDLSRTEVKNHYQSGPDYN